MKKFTRKQIEKRILKNECIKNLDLDEFQVSNLTSFIHALSQDRSVFLTEANDSNSEWCLYYVNEEYKTCRFWVTPFMDRSKNKYGRKYCFRSTIQGMDRILAATNYLMNVIEKITGSYVQLSRKNLL